jgi:hypothetical protein
MFYEEAREQLILAGWEIVLSDDEAFALVERFKNTNVDDLPNECDGLTYTDLFNILLFFDGGREKCPDRFMFGLSYRADGMPKFGLCVPD